MGRSDEQLASPATAPERRLQSWKEIALYLDRAVRTVQRWERAEGMPVHRHFHDKGGSVWALSSELDEWWRSRRSDLERQPSGPAPGEGRLGILRGVLTVLVVLLAVTLPFSSRPVGPLPAAGTEPTWLLIVLDNRSGQPLLGGALEHEMAQEVERSSRVRVVPRPRIDDTLRLMKRPADSHLDLELAHEVALRDGGISVIVAVRVASASSAFSVSARLLDTRERTPLGQAEAQVASESEVLEAVRRQGRWVRSVLGDGTTTSHGAGTVERVTTPSLAALHRYSRAMELGTRGMWAAAEPLLRESVAEDPDFASAHMLLAWSLVNQERPRAEWEAPAQRARELAPLASETERDFILGSCYSILGDVFRASEAYEAVLRRRPDHFWSVNNLAWSYSSQGRPREAAAMFTRLRRMRPHDFRIQAHAARAVGIWLADLEAARPLLSQAADLAAREDLFPEPQLRAWVHLFSAHESWLAGDLAAVRRAADEAVDRARRSGGRERSAWASQGALLHLTLGRLKDARVALEGADGEIVRAARIFLACAREDAIELRQSLTPASVDPGPWMFEPLLTARAGTWPPSVMLARMQSEGYPPAGLSLAEGARAFARGQNFRAVPLLARGVSLERHRGTAEFFLGSQLLAEAWARGGRPAEAARVLEEASLEQKRAYSSLGSAGALWLAVRSQLSDLHRKQGRPAQAEALETELGGWLAHADPDHPLQRRLRAQRVLLTGEAPAGGS